MGSTPPFALRVLHRIVLNWEMRCALHYTATPKQEYEVIANFLGRSRKTINAGVLI